MVKKKNRDYAERFSMRFRLLMSYHSLTLQDIAAQTGCAVSTVGTWKNGRIPSTDEVIQKLCELFNVSEDFLLDGRARGETAPDLQHASRILRDIDDLLRELGEEDFIREPERLFERGLTEEGMPDGQDAKKLQRLQIEAYFNRFLDIAERHPDGLSFTWIQLLREFPQDLFRGLRGRGLEKGKAKFKT